MLKCAGGTSDEKDLAGACWVDLCSPTDEEIARVERQFGIELPSRESLSEIEASSRLRVHQGQLTMSAPLVARQGETSVLAPTGFLLQSGRLITIRFAEMTAFDETHEAIAKADHKVGGQEALVRLLEELVDRSADRLERVAEDITSASHAIFRNPRPGQKRRLGRETRRLRALMVRIGRSSEQMVKVRHAFLAIGRIAAFVADRCEPAMESGLRDRLVSVRHDIESLDEFENSLTGRVQLLIDAAVAFISIEQNDVVKVLTVVSVAGVPPVLVAGIYGMNFHVMPELSWTWGYPFAMVLMVASTILPVLWFKWRDWL
ncbi:CorA family divalent cation transporter [Sphingomonas sp. PR090111-T3T-6A]|uniref:CorA family divalent cation transporter n=1 Tax=Sphingomonas sp. PR090111-T3T-6A TaxID=685778 RepID=UPI00037643E6|nr:CorA family divalent cation transporter [Sphingomonas sp. PR090111-T3T-6A]